MISLSLWAVGFVQCVVTFASNVASDPSNDIARSEIVAHNNDQIIFYINFILSTDPALICMVYCKTA